MNRINEIKLIYQNKSRNATKITSSEMAYKVFLENWDTDIIELQEEFKVLFLNRANKVLGIYHMSKGGVSGTVVDVKLLLAAALKANASGLIVAHNHPSGNLKPSEQDRTLTKKIKTASNYMDLNFLDHLIIFKDGFYSFSDEGNF